MRLKSDLFNTLSYKRRFSSLRRYARFTPESRPSSGDFRFRAVYFHSPQRADVRDWGGARTLRILERDGFITAGDGPLGST